MAKWGVLSALTNTFFKMCPYLFIEIFLALLHNLYSLELVLDFAVEIEKQEQGVKMLLIKYEQVPWIFETDTKDNILIFDL
jgi:hypothetical protein